MSGVVRMLGISLIALALATTLPRPVRADTPPSSWEVAKDPAARDRYALHVLVRDLVSQEMRSSPLRDGVLERARSLLEDSGAAKSPDVRLRFDLGEVYQESKRHDLAINVLSAALKSAPKHPAAESAWVALAQAYAMKDMPTEERDAYEQYLVLATDDLPRAVAILNVAEADMRVGHLEEAIAGYRDVVNLSAALASGSSVETGILAVWGLAVALDRAGDLLGSAEQAKLAIQMDVGQKLIAHSPNVYFVPAYECLWYLALGSTAQAKNQSDARLALEHWWRVEQVWERYLQHADPKERWLPLARAHLARAHAERVAAEKRGTKLPDRLESLPDPECSGTKFRN
jgi:tetratricopeptide (TPR) repeat protein